MSWDTHELCIAARSRDWGRQQWKSRKGHWDKSSLNDLEPQVWKSQALNEADGWQLKIKEASPPAWLSCFMCVLFSLLWFWRVVETWEWRLLVTYAIVWWPGQLTSNFAILHSTFGQCEVLALVSVVFMLPSILKGNGVRHNGCTCVFLVYNETCA